MSVMAVPATYRTTDGEEFATEEQASRHQDLLDAHDEFRSARLRYGKALARTQRTADGVLFGFEFWGKYYHITEGWAGLPSIVELDLPGYTFDFTLMGEEFAIIGGENVGGRRSEYRVSTLYRHRRNAETALLAQQERWLAERTKEVEATRAKVAPSPASPE